MKTKHSNIYKATKLGTLVCIALWFILSFQEVRAYGYEECKQILTQDIFNKVIKSDSSSSASASETKAAFYSQKDTEAFEAYKNARSEARKNGTSIDAEGHYGIIGGELGIDVNSEHEESFESFSQKFNEAKSTYQNSSEHRTSASQDVESTYASYIRDPGTVSAWLACVSKTDKTNLYAFASRDNAGKAYVNVMWVPGLLAASLPKTITIDFVTDNDAEGVKVHSDENVELAAGSGKSFAVSCGTKCDNGYQITVNGTLNNDTGPTNNLTAMVNVPPLNPPTQPESTTRRFTLLGKWQGSYEANGQSNPVPCPVEIYEDNGENIKGNCDDGITSHELTGVYENPSKKRVSITIVRKGFYEGTQQDCTTQVNGYIDDVEANSYHAWHEGYSGCGVRTAPIDSTWMRVK